MKKLMASASLACSLAFVVALASAEENGASSPPSATDSSLASPGPTAQQPGTVPETVEETTVYRKHTTLTPSGSSTGTMGSSTSPSNQGAGSVGGDRTTSDSMSGKSGS